MAYTVEFERWVLRQFEALPRQVQIRLRPRIEALAEVRDEFLVVLVVKVGHRRDVYRR